MNFQTHQLFKLEFEPGSKYQYNNSGYYLLGSIIEEVTGKSFETVLQDNILVTFNTKKSQSMVDDIFCSKKIFKKLT